MSEPEWRPPYDAVGNPLPRLPELLPDGWGADDPRDMNDTPFWDLAKSLEEGRICEGSWFNPIVPTADRVFTACDVRAVHHARVAYSDELWEPGQRTYSGYCDLVAVVETWDGLWLTVNATTQYTGWAYGSDLEVRVYANRDDAVYFGLDRAGRRVLGLPPNRPDVESGDHRDEILEVFPETTTEPAAPAPSPGRPVLIPRPANYTLAPPSVERSPW